MRKFLLALLLVSTAMFALIGCSSNDSTTPDSNVSSKYTVTIFYNNQEYKHEYDLNDTFYITILDNIDTSNDFDYWYYLSNGYEVEITGNLKVTTNISIFAKYKTSVTPPTTSPDDNTEEDLEEVIVTIINNGDKVTVKLEKEEIFNISILNNITTSEGFVSWYYIFDGKEVQVNESFKVASNITIYAKYEGSDGTTGTLPWV